MPLSVLITPSRYATALSPSAIPPLGSCGFANGPLKSGLPPAQPSPTVPCFTASDRREVWRPDTVLDQPADAWVHLALSSAGFRVPLGPFPLCALMMALVCWNLRQIPGLHSRFFSPPSLHPPGPLGSTDGIHLSYTGSVQARPFPFGRTLPAVAGHFPC